ncbi:MAG: ATP synthase subunit I [Deltaproteobacteria bacterium]|nr:ATP synthase subunit I [Deltaproteobacteria bacterium]
MAHNDAYFPLDRMGRLNWLLLVVMTAAGGFLVSPYFAKGLFIGGLIANISFILLKKNITRVLSGPLHSAKGRFLIMYYIRLTVLALILFFLVKYKAIHFGGLVVGLSTVVISIGTMVAGAARKVALTAKEAS